MMGMNPLDVFPDSIPRAKTCDVTRTHPPSEGLLFDKKLNWEDFLHWRYAIYTQALFSDLHTSYIFPEPVSRQSLTTSSIVSMQYHTNKAMHYDAIPTNAMPCNTSLPKKRDVSLSDTIFNFDKL